MGIIYFLLIAIFPKAFGWGGDGHRIITTLARNLTTSLNIESLLDPLGDLMKASTWADTDEAEELYPLSGAYHFSSTPYRKCSAFDMNRDCGFGKTKAICIVTGLSEAIARAVDPTSSESVRVDSLKFILHLMADIHQPLHTGFRADSGGVRIKLEQPEGVDLHSVWDTVLINELKAQKHVAEWQGLVGHFKTRLGSGVFEKRIRYQSNFTDILTSESGIERYVAGLASETSLNTTCRSGYKSLEDEWIGVGDHLTPDFYLAKTPIVEVQLLKASVRLAILLDAIADMYYLNRLSAKEARRSDRIAKLFSRREDLEPPRDTLENNQFANLAIEFDPIASEYDPLTDIASTRRSKPKKSSLSVGKPSAETDETFLDDEAASVAKERASYTFFGIDLSEVVLVKRRGSFLVSTKSKVSVLGYLPFIFVVPVRFLNSGGTPVEYLFGFDGTVFSNNLCPELVIRSMLRISGIDPRIDLKEPEGSSIQPLYLLPPRKASPIIPKLRAQYIQRRPVDITFTARRILSLKRFIIAHQISDLSFVFVHRDTLTKPLKTRMIFNRFRYNEKSVLYSFYIDHAISDGPIQHGDLFKVLVDTARPNSMNVLKHRYAQQFVSEMKEVDMFINIGRNDFVTGKNIDWVVDYPVESYDIVEWIRKGIFPSQRQLLEFLGVTIVSEEALARRQDAQCLITTTIGPEHRSGNVSGVNVTAGASETVLVTTSSPASLKDADQTDFAIELSTTIVPEDPTVVVPPDNTSSFNH